MKNWQKIFIIIVIIFVITAALQMIIVKNDSNDYFYPVNYSDIIYPKDKIIIIRMDDVQGLWLNKTQIYLIDLILTKDIPVVLGVIPGRINEDTLLKTYLQEKVKDHRIEIAQHGTNHSTNELLNLTYNETYDKTKLGLKELMKLGIRPVTYIPPGDAYNNFTTKAISELGFRIFSGQIEPLKYDGNMIHVGYDVSVRNWPSNELFSVNKILDSCNKSLNRKNLCVINIHPQDYIRDDNNIDPDKLAKLIELLDGLKKLNVKFATFKDLQNYWE